MRWLSTVTCTSFMTVLQIRMMNRPTWRKMVSDSTTLSLSFLHTCSPFPSWAAGSRQMCQFQTDFCFPPDLLPKPSLSAWPNAVPSDNSNVFCSMCIRCVSPTPGIQLVLRKGDKVLEPRLPHHLTEGTAEFHLTNVRLSHAGYYTCECYLKEFPDKISPSSEVLLLLVTGEDRLPQKDVHRSLAKGEGGSKECW